jgi:hypothetical protein
MSKHYTHKELDNMFADIRINYAAIIMDLEERIAHPRKMLGFIGKQVKASSAANFKLQEKCIDSLNLAGLAESKRLYAITNTHHKSPEIYKARKDFAHEFHKLLTVIFQEKSKNLPQAPCQELPRVLNLMNNKRTGLAPYEIASTSRLISKYYKNEHRDKVSSPQHHHHPPPDNTDGGMGAPTSTYKIDAPDVPVTGYMPQVPTHKPTSNKATERVAINLTIGGGRRLTRRRSSNRRRKTACKRRQ